MQSCTVKPRNDNSAVFHSRKGKAESDSRSFQKKQKNTSFLNREKWDLSLFACKPCVLLGPLPLHSPITQILYLFGDTSISLLSFQEIYTNNKSPIFAAHL